MKRIFNLLMFLMLCTIGQATHNRAGQLLYRHVSGYTYEFTQTQFFNTLSPATEQRLTDGLDVFWGDNTKSKIQCVHEEVERLPDNYTKGVFRMRHTFPGPGVYTIIMEDINRNEGVENIPNSVGVAFSVKTIFRIDPNIRPNNTPQLLTYPIDKAAVGRRFVHNPSAYDIDGDSLSYELAVCTREQGIEIESYRFPEASKELYVDAVSGDFVWDAPVTKGLYNVAMKINEWRDGMKIGSIARDMQIEVVDSKNRPPVLPDFKDTCVIAGAKISIPIHVTDPDNDEIVLKVTGGPFQVNDSVARFKVDSKGPGFTNATFTWQTINSHVRKQKYTVVFKAEDQNTEVKLVSFANYNITVIAPKVENLTVTAEKKDIQLEWNQTICDHASGYEIYRSMGSNNFNLGPCETGIPSGSGYEKIATLDGLDHTFYKDNNNGKGLSPGIEYCYRVVAIFTDGAKSLPSDEACASLLAGTPPMIRAHVETVGVSGEIHAAWLEKPSKEKMADKPGPFEYRLFHSMDRDNWPSTPLVTKSLGDTTFIHAPINTKAEYPHYYKVELWDLGAKIIVDEDFEVASTLYPILQPSDKSAIIIFGRYTPWVNDDYEIYRCVKTGTDICIPDASDRVGSTSRETYQDFGLRNGQQYCYRIESKGFRKIDGITWNNDNWSHVACVTPIDNVPPCPPELTGESICEEERNQLEWTYDPECMYDVEKYRIYFSLNPAIYAYSRIDSVMSRNILTYSHRGSLIGCYYVTAVDSAGNQSRASNIVCLDKCGDYQLPNVFTPNGDNINDVFKSFNPGRVFKVDMQICNRVGKLVFKTNDPDINWDGRDIDSKRFVPSGVYYYTCTVYEERLNETRTIPLAGIIHVYYGKGAQPYIPPIE